MQRRNRRNVLTWLSLGMLFAGVAGPARAQTLLAADDDYGIPYGAPLVVEPFGVLSNDSLDGQSAGENGATAELVDDVSHGILVLGSDGSFTYTPGSGFDGSDSFTYNAVYGGTSAPARFPSPRSVTSAACASIADRLGSASEVPSTDRPMSPNGRTRPHRPGSPHDPTPGTSTTSAATTIASGAIASASAAAGSAGPPI